MMPLFVVEQEVAGSWLRVGLYTGLTPDMALARCRRICRAQGRTLWPTLRATLSQPAAIVGNAD
jgi:hypothetical protein